jgi:hypothetical protein
VAARTFGNIPVSCLTASQLNALAAKDIEVNDIIDESCQSLTINTCDRDTLSLLQTYPTYNTAKGIATKWGDIAAPWGFESEFSVESWGSARYVGQVSYVSGETIVRIESDGYRVAVYEALEDIPAPAGPFNRDLWKEICHASSSVPVGLPNVSSLSELYSYYNPRGFGTTWGEFNESWGKDLVDPNSDEWGQARFERESFYETGNVALYDSRCGDYTCAYVAIKPMPNDPDLIRSGPPPKEYWEKLYCVPNGKPNICEKKVTCTRPNTKLVSLTGRDEDLVCLPVESTVGVGPRR